jgi:hypothetical protein
MRPPPTSLPLLLPPLPSSLSSTSAMPLASLSLSMQTPTLLLLLLPPLVVVVEVLLLLMSPLLLVPLLMPLVVAVLLLMLPMPTPMSTLLTSGALRTLLVKR